MVLARPVGLLLHGAGADPGSALRLLATALAPDVEPVAVAHGGSIERAVEAIEDQAADPSAELAAVVGLSVGAHAAATWAARSGGSGDLALVMPAWTGAPDGVAALTRASADEIEQDGVEAALARIEAEAGRDWVVDELVRCWRAADPRALVRTLRAAGAGAAPALADLARIRARTVVVALADDPLHPLAVAEEWAGAIPGARLVVVPRDACDHDRGALGTAARRALQAWDDPRG